MSKKKGGGKKSSKRKPPGRKASIELQPEGKGRDPFMVPSWVMLPVGIAVGGFVARWVGAVFGGILGFFLWRSRR